MARVQAQVRTRILRAIASRGLIERFEAREMARGPPLWDECDAQGADCVGQGAPTDPDWGESAQAAPDDAPDQRTDW